MINTIIFITPNYPNIYSKNGNVFVKDQMNVLKNKYNIIIFSCILVSFLDLYKFGFRGLGLKKINQEKIFGLLIFLPAIPKLLAVSRFFRDLVTLIILFINRKKISKNSLFYLHGTEISLLALGIKFILKRKYILMEHSSLLLKSKSNTLFESIIKYSLVGASRILAVSHDLAERIENKYLVRVEVLNNVIDFDQFHSNMSESSNDFYTIITVGSLVDIKNHTFLIDAFWSKFELKKNVILKIIGEGPNERMLKQKIKKMNAENRIYLLGYLSKKMICDELMRAQLFTMTSFYETFCVSIAEAMYCELPIVATKFGGITSYLTELDGCRLVDFKIEDLGDSMMYFYMLPKNKFPLNKEFVENEYSKIKFLSKFGSIIENLKQ